MASDAQVLSDIGLDFIMKVARIAFEGVFYGIYLLLMYFWVIVYRKSGLHSTGAVFLFIVTLVMFLGGTLFYAMDIADIVMRFKIILMSNLDQPVEDKLAQADDATKQLLWTGEMLFIFMLTLGDSVVVWRTWALYQENRKWLIIPLLTWTGSVVAAFYELGCDIHTHWAVNNPDPTAASVGAESCAKADTASYSMSFGTNFICTGLIIHKAWLHRKFMSEYLGPSRKRTKAEKVLTLLIESGSVYLVLYTLQAVPIYGGTTPASFIPWEIVNAIIQQGMGMYPTAIVVLVQMQKSLWADTGSESTRYDPHPDTPQSRMEFAHGRETTTAGTVGYAGVSHSTAESTAYNSGLKDKSHALIHATSTDDPEKMV